MTSAPSKKLSQDFSVAAMSRACLVTGLLFALGCQAEDVDQVYGHRSGGGARSVNGTAVLAKMFEQARFHVSAWRLLSPKLDNEQVIVWAPDKFGAPSSATVRYFETWLKNQPHRTLVYIGRDYDGATDFWEQVIANAGPEQRIELRNKLATLKSEYTFRRNAEKSLRERKCKWFRYELSGDPTIDLEMLDGKWSRGLEAAALNISLPTKMVISEDEKNSFQIEPLLMSPEGMLAASIQRPSWRGSKIILVANGSWLLNLPLVNPEHRVLAQALIDECGPPSRVCILQSGPEDPRVSENDNSPPLMLRAFTVWPVNVILLHATVLGILFCFAIFPVFGRPRRVASEAVSDFGKHVTAVGELLESGGDADYARQRLKAYQEMQHSKQGVET